MDNSAVVAVPDVAATEGGLVRLTPPACGLRGAALAMALALVGTLLGARASGSEAEGMTEGGEQLGAARLLVMVAPAGGSLPAGGSWPVVGGVADGAGGAGMSSAVPSSSSACSSPAAVTTVVVTARPAWDEAMAAGATAGEATGGWGADAGACDCATAGCLAGGAAVTVAVAVPAAVPVAEGEKAFTAGDSSATEGDGVGGIDAAAFVTVPATPCSFSAGPPAGAAALAGLRAAAAADADTVAANAPAAPALAYCLPGGTRAGETEGGAPGTARDRGNVLRAAEEGGIVAASDGRP